MLDAKVHEDLQREYLADPDSGAFMHKWTNDDRVMIACCNDGTRPVIFKLECIDIPETEDERAYLEAHDFVCRPGFSTRETPLPLAHARGFYLLACVGRHRKGPAGPFAALLIRIALSSFAYVLSCYLHTQHFPAPLWQLQATCSKNPLCYLPCWGEVNLPPA